jgi:serine/threonine protein kinase
MAKIEEVTCTNALCYSRLEFIEGATLRELRKHGPISLDTAIEISSALDNIQNNPLVRYHGDLTPDNIMISYSSVKLLDAGYFGALDCLEGMVEDAAITTPAYYPFLTPNDMLAMGIIFWEMHFGMNPFGSFEEVPAQAAGISQALVRVLKGYSSIGRPFVNSMARLPLPRILEPGIHPELERFLLASLGLRLNEQNELDPAARFETFEQMSAALQNLTAHGITEL